MLCLFLSGSLSSQNLIINHDFESYTSCPNGFNTPGNPDIQCTPWVSGGWGTTDYLHECSTSPDTDVPVNFGGYQEALSGVAYAGFIAQTNAAGDYREYVQGPLESTLEGGKWYEVYFYVSLSNERCGIEQIGAYFSADPPPYNFAEPILVTPQVESDGIFLSDTLNWMLIYGCFRANGDEDLITIGNFHSNADTPLDPLCTGFPNSYYYLEDVYVGEVQPGGLDIELGGPVSDCVSYTIAPGITGVDYFWEDGSTGPTLTVTSSGTYSVTIYDGCQAGTDSIEVEILNAPPVNLEPDEITICQGESVTITLDPELGTYTWNDGSNDAVYEITTSGVYTVTMDDGCDITVDHIEVTVVDSPAMFSLGNDTTICTGTQIEFEFDPDLGDFLWHDNNPSNFYVVSAEGYYALTITNMCGEASAEIEISVIDPEEVNLGPSEYQLCTGEILEYAFDPALGDYEWQDGSTSPMYQIQTSGIYSVTLSHYCGPSIDFIEVMVLTEPDVEIGDTLYACPGDTLLLSAAGLTGHYTWQDGSDQLIYQVTSPGIYALTVENICGMDQDEVVVFYEQSLNAPDLGPDIRLCPGETVTLDVQTAGAQYLWQDMSTGDTMWVNQAGTYFVHVFNTCQFFSDTMEVTIDDIPPVIGFPDQLILCQGEVMILDPQITGATYSWSDGSSAPTYQVNAPGDISLTVSNACGSDVDTILILDGGESPTVALGPDLSVCTGEVITLNPTSSNAGSWLWMDGSTEPFFTTSTEGPVFVEVSNVCGVAYDTMDITLLPLTPPLQLGTDIFLCPGESQWLTIPDPSWQIQWSDGSDDVNYIVTDADVKVYATVTNGCGSSSDTILVQVLPPAPILLLGPDQSLCPGEVVIIDPGLSGVIYAWHDGSSQPAFQVTQPTTVILTVSNACGMATDTVEVVESTDGPQVDLGPDILGCIGDSTLILSGISGVTYLWSDGSNGPNYWSTSTGWVYLTVNNLCGTDTDSIWVNMDAVEPAPDLGEDTTLCEGNTLMLMSDAASPTTITWHDGTSGMVFLVSDEGLYWLTESNHCGTSSDTIHVEILALPPLFSLGEDTVLCPGESLLLSAPPTDDVLMWQDGSTQPELIANQAAWYSLTISNACGQSSDSLELTIHTDVPEVLLPPSLAWCPGDQIVLDASQSFDASYTWSNGATQSAITVSLPGPYEVTVTTPCTEAEGSAMVEEMEDCPEEGDIYIPTVFSPDGDQQNDVFTIFFAPALDVISLNGSIYDRWGNMVYTTQAMPFIWDGNWKNKKMMSGVYVYMMSVRMIVDGVEVEKQYTGDITLIR